MANKKNDIAQHIFNHAEIVKFTDGTSAKEIVDEKELKKIAATLDDEIINFKFTYDFSNFENEEDAKEKLKIIIDELNGKSKDTSYTKEKFRKFGRDDEKEKEFENRKDIEIISKEYIKDIYYNKERDLVKYTFKKKYERLGKIENCFMAVHVKSFEEYKGEKIHDVFPHIHIVFNKSKNNFGRDYKGLKDIILETNSKHNLVCSLQKIDKKTDEKLSKEELSQFKILSSRLSAFLWAVSKNNEYYLKKEKQYLKNENCVTLNNLEDKVNKYIELGGSINFAEKLKSKVKIYFDKDINYTLNKKELKAIDNIKNKRYIDIIEDVSYFAVNNYKIPESYRELNNYKSDKILDISEIKIAKVVKEIFRNSCYKYKDNIKYIDVEKIQEIKDKYVREFGLIEKDKHINNIEKILTQKELREYINNNKINLKDFTDKTEFQLLFDNNYNYVSENIEIDKFNIFDKKYLIEKITENINILNLEISEKWKNNIVEKLSNYIIEETRKDKEKYTEQKANMLDEIKEKINLGTEEILELHSDKNLRLKTREYISNLDYNFNNFEKKYFENTILKDNIKIIREFSNIIRKDIPYNEINIFDKKSLSNKISEKLIESDYALNDKLINTITGKISNDIISEIRKDKEKYKEHKYVILDKINKKIDLKFDETVQMYLNKNLRSYIGETISKLDYNFNNFEKKYFENNITKLKIKEIDNFVSKHNKINKILYGYERIKEIKDERKNMIDSGNINSERLKYLDKAIAIDDRKELSNYSKYLDAKLEYELMRYEYKDRGINIPDFEELSGYIIENNNLKSIEGLKNELFEDLVKIPADKIIREYKNEIKDEVKYVNIFKENNIDKVYISDKPNERTGEEVDLISSGSNMRNMGYDIVSQNAFIERKTGFFEKELEKDNKKISLYENGFKVHSGFENNDNEKLRERYYINMLKTDKISESLIKAARAVNIADYLVKQGYTLTKDSKNNYKVKEIPGVVVSENGKWYDFSSNKGGKAIDFLVTYQNYSFKEAVERLNTGNYEKGIVKMEDREIFKLPERDSNDRRLFAYLVKTRNISPEIIEPLVKQGLIYQTTNGNIAFIGQDKNGEAKYCFERGTITDSQFKGESKGSQKEYGFQLPGTTKEHGIVFVYESPIDLLSHSSIKGQEYVKEYDRISLGGLTDKALERYLADNPHVKHIRFCLDNDEWGLKARDEFIKKYEEKGYKSDFALPEQKDWNEDLAISNECKELSKNELVSTLYVFRHSERKEFVYLEIRDEEGKKIIKSSPHKDVFNAPSKDRIPYGSLEQAFALLSIRGYEVTAQRKTVKLDNKEYTEKELKAIGMKLLINQEKKEADIIEYLSEAKRKVMEKEMNLEKNKEIELAKTRQRQRGIDL